VEIWDTFGRAPYVWYTVYFLVNIQLNFYTFIFLYFTDHCKDRYMFKCYEFGVTGQRRTSSLLSIPCKISSFISGNWTKSEWTILQPMHELCWLRSWIKVSVDWLIDWLIEAKFFLSIIEKGWILSENRSLINPLAFTWGEHSLTWKQL
jgi:hypothetical protein